MIKNCLREINLKSGGSIPQGATVEITLGANNLTATYKEREIKLGYRNANKNFGAPFGKVPSLATLEKWSDDGIARSVTGKRVEPDGFDSMNGPSWLLVLGLI